MPSISIQSKVPLKQDEEGSAASLRLLSKATCHYHSLSPRCWVAVVMAAILVIISMVMLLLWNYKCIVIDHLCQGIQELETPIFTNH